MAIQDDIDIDKNNRIVDYVGAVSGINPTNRYSWGENYTYLSDFFDEPQNIDTPRPIKFNTPTLYEAQNKWYFTERFVRSTYAGAIESTDWTRVDTTENGIVMIYYSAGTDPVNTDRGLPIVDATDGDSGVLLDFDTTRSVIWVRPDDELAANNFGTTGHILAVTGGSGSVTQGNAAITGETAYGNFFSVGSIPSDSEIELMQVDDWPEVVTPALTKVVSWWNEDVDFTDPKGRNPEYKAGHIDVVHKIKEMDQVVDQGVIFGINRQYLRTYSFFSTVATAASRNVIAFGGADDVGVTTGYRNNVMTSSTGTIAIGDIVTGGSSGAEGIVTASAGSNPTADFDYVLIGQSLADGTLNDFEASEALTFSPSGAGGDSAAGLSTNVGPAADTSITVTFGSFDVDVDQDDTTENYSAQVDCNSQAMSEVHERLQFYTRRGNNTDIDSGAQTILGESYLGIGDIVFNYDAEGTGPVTAGTLVEKSTDSTITGIVTSIKDNGSTGWVVLRQVRGTFADDDIVREVAATTNNVTILGTPETIGLSAAPFGNRAGTLQQFARGVVPINVAGADATNYTVTPTEPGSALVNPPNSVSVTGAGLTAGDRIFVARVETSPAEVAGSKVFDRDEWTLAAAGGGQNTLGDSQIEIDTSILARVPGKTTGGVLHVVDVSASPAEEHRYRFDAWAAAIFTLAGDTGGQNEGSCTTTDATGVLLTDSAGAFDTTDDVEIGDLVYNATDTSWAYVKSIDSATQLTLSQWGGPGTNFYFTSADTYTINHLVATYTTSDKAWVPLLSGVATGATFETTLVYPGTDILATYFIRYSSGAGKIIPETGPVTVGSNGVTITARRDSDGVA